MIDFDAVGRSGDGRGGDFDRYVHELVGGDDRCLTWQGRETLRELWLRGHEPLVAGSLLGSSALTNDDLAVAATATESALAAGVPAPPRYGDMVQLAIAGIELGLAAGQAEARKLWDGHAHLSWPSTVEQARVAWIPANGGSWNWAFAATAFAVVAGVYPLGGVRRLAGLCEAQMAPLSAGGVGFNGQELGSGLYFRFNAAAIAACLVVMDKEVRVADELRILYAWLAMARDWLTIHDTPDGCLCVGQRYPVGWWEAATHQLSNMVASLRGEPPRFKLDRNHYSGPERIVRYLGKLSSDSLTPSRGVETALRLERDGFYARVPYTTWVQHDAQGHVTRLEAMADRSMHGSTPPLCAAGYRMGETYLAATHPAGIRGHGGKRLGTFDVHERAGIIEVIVSLDPGQDEAWRRGGYTLPDSLPHGAEWDAETRQIRSAIPRAVDRGAESAFGIEVDRRGARVLGSTGMGSGDPPPADRAAGRYERALEHAVQALRLEVAGSARRARAHLGRIAGLAPESWAKLPLKGES